MKLPIFIIMLLPEKWKKAQIQKRWDYFSDEDILTSYREDTEWIDALNGLYRGEPSPILDRYQKHLDQFVMPQIIKRGLEPLFNNN